MRLARRCPPALTLALVLLAAGSAAAQSGATCAGDCNDDRTVAISELVEAVAVAIGLRPLRRCLPADGDADGRVRVAELITAVSAAQMGCPALPDLPLHMRYPAPGLVGGFGPALADFNGDGHLDWLSVPSVNFTARLAVRLGFGDGRFAAAQVSSLPPNYLAANMTVGDLDRDGALDVVTSNLTTDNTSVFLGRGDGTFDPPTQYPAGDRPDAIALGDLNADGSLDVAIGNIASHDVTVLLGFGDGTFAAPVFYATGGIIPRLAGIADATGDGLLDLVVGNQQFGILATLPGRGDGTFGDPIVTETGLTLYRPVLADLNGDGAIDVASPNTFENSLSVHLGQGDGTFVTLPPLATGAQGFSLAVGDVNGDGIPDLVAPFRGLIEAADTGTFLVLLGNGDGTFERTSFRYGEQSSRVVLHDVNEDGNVDIAATGGAVIFGTGGGRFSTGQRLSLGVTDLVVGDMNEDGRPDIAMVARPQASEGRSGLTVLLANVERGLTAIEPQGLGDRSASELACADMNRDGHLDLVARTPKGFADGSPAAMTVLLGDGRGRFAIHHVREFQTFSEGSNGVAVADFTGDAIPDVVDQGTTFLFVGAADGTLGAAQPLTVRGSTQHQGKIPLAVDVNRDGVMDLVFSGRNVVVAIGSGDGSFTATHLIPNRADGGSHSRASLGDVNGDGHLDLVRGVNNAPVHGSVRAGGGAHVSHGNGDGTFDEPVVFPIDAGGFLNDRSVTSLTDVNRDGRLDIVVPVSQALTILLGSTDGSFGPAQEFFLGFDTTAYAVANLNGDSLPDIIIGGPVGLNVLFAADRLPAAQLP